MRLVIDTLIAVMLVAVLALVLLHHQGRQRGLRQQEQVRHALVRLQDQTLFHTALGEAPQGRDGFAKMVSPSWFPEGVPVNPLVPPDQPWLDVAPEGDRHENPPDPVVTGPGQAGFWYSPRRGIFRARIAPQYSEERTVELYNEINGTNLASLAKPADAEARAPIAAAPKQAKALPAAPAVPAASAVPPAPAQLATLRDQGGKPTR